MKVLKGLETLPIYQVGFLWTKVLVIKANNINKPIIMIKKWRISWAQQSKQMLAVVIKVFSSRATEKTDS